MPNKTAPTKNPYRYSHLPNMVATFHRDELVTGANLSLSENDVAHKFQFNDVCAINMHDHTEATETEGMTDASYSSSHDDDHHHDEAFHHRQFPSVPTVAADEEEARLVIHAQVQVTTGKRANKPLHRYMIKQVHAKCSNSEQALAHLKNETRLIKKLGHQHYNLLTLRATACEGESSVFASQWDAHFMLTDRISETLAQRIQRWKEEANHACLRGHGKAVSPPKAQVDTTSPSFRMKVVYAQNLANVLAFLHSKKIVVRNLSPESIGFLASDDTLQLMDLGQAVEVEQRPSSQQPRRTAGEVNACTLLAQQNQHALFQMTPGGQPYRYMAPELLTTPLSPQDTSHAAASSSSTTSTCTVDCYSWAMICFEMVTLHQPYDKMKAGQHLKQVGFRNPSLRPQLGVYQLPRTLENLLKRAWRQDPAQRLEATVIDKRLKDLLQAELHQPQRDNNNSPQLTS